jgi:hypothetical protein
VPGAKTISSTRSIPMQSCTSLGRCRYDVHEFLADKLSLDVFHTLHCLVSSRSARRERQANILQNMVRKGLHRDHYPHAGHFPGAHLGLSPSFSHSSLLICSSPLPRHHPPTHSMLWLNHTYPVPVYGCYRDRIHRLRSGTYMPRLQCTA